MRITRQQLRKLILEEISISYLINENIQIAGQEARADGDGNVVIGDKKFSLHKLEALSWSAKAADAAGSLGEDGAKIDILGIYEKEGTPSVKGKLGVHEADIPLTSKMISVIKSNLNKPSFAVDGDNIRIEFKKI